MNHYYRGHYAGFVSRLVAFTADLFFITITLAALAWFANTINDFFGITNLLRNVPRIDYLISAFAALTAVLATSLCVVFYFLFFWILTGRTPGKMLLGLRVVTLDGQRLTFLRALRRLFGLALAALPLFGGFLWILIDNRRQGLHDKLAGTCVVYDWAARPDERFMIDLLDELSTPHPRLLRRLQQKHLPPTQR